MDQFYTRLADALELDRIAGSDVLADFEEWDSLSVLSVIAMIGRNYGVHLTARDIRQVSTAQDLRDLVVTTRVN
jgi:acyl carrier protein